jgi:hypothetical protein
LEGHATSALLLDAADEDEAVEKVDKGIVAEDATVERGSMPKEGPGLGELADCPGPMETATGDFREGTIGTENVFASGKDDGDEERALCCPGMPETGFSNPANLAINARERSSFGTRGCARAASKVEYSRRSNLTASNREEKSSVLASEALYFSR